MMINFDWTPLPLAQNIYILNIAHFRMYRHKK